MFSSKLAGAQLRELVYVRVTRALVVTRTHVLYCRSHHVEPGVTNYKLRWLVQLADIHTITGAQLSADSDIQRLWGAVHR